MEQQKRSNPATQGVVVLVVIWAVICIMTIMTWSEVSVIRMRIDEQMVVNEKVKATNERVNKIIEQMEAQYQEETK